MKPGAPTILLLGPQGSGKGTQAMLLARKYRFLHIEMGELLRELRDKVHPRPFEKKVAAVIDKGRLVPSAWVIRMLDERLSHISPKRGVILDGSGRRLREAKALFPVLKRHGRSLTHVMLIEISSHETIRRLAKRWVCVRRHHLLTMGKDVRHPNDACPRCGSPIMQRPDDTPKAISKRLAIYRRETKPVATYFAQKHLLDRINGERPISAVFRDVDRVYQRSLR